MNFKDFSLLIFAVIFTSGCAVNDDWRASPETVDAEIAGVEIKASPVCTGSGCKAFLVQLKNTTDQNVEVDWNNTLYIKNGQTSGTFMYEGIVYSKRHEQKAPDIIFPENKIIKAIRPVNLVTYTSGQYGGWRHQAMPAGENGIYFDIKVGDNKHNKKITSEISVEEN